VLQAIRDHRFAASRQLVAEEREVICEFAVERLSPIPSRRRRRGLMSDHSWAVLAAVVIPLDLVMLLLWIAAVAVTWGDWGDR
jgi:hypothetical protein